VAAVQRVFSNTTRYAISVGTVYTSWEAAVNVSSGPSSRSVDLVYGGTSTAPPATPASDDDDGPNMFAAALALGLVAVAFILVLFLVRNRIRCCGGKAAAAKAPAGGAVVELAGKPAPGVGVVSSV